MIDHQLRAAVQAHLSAGKTSQRALAKEAAVSQPTIHKFIHGGNIELSVAARLADAVGLTLAEEPSKS